VFDADNVNTIIEIPERIKVVELLPEGYPADQPRKKRRPQGIVQRRDKITAAHDLSFFIRPPRPSSINVAHKRDELV